LFRPRTPFAPALLLLLTGAGAALAQGLPPLDPGQRLRELEAELDRSRAAHDEIRSKAAGLAEETGRLRADMVKAARAAQESEDLLSELEFQLDELREREESRSEALKRRSQQMVGVLTALQRLAWRPTEALIAQPQSPADTVRSAILLRAAVPQIEQSAHDLRGEIDSVTRLRAEIGEQKKRIAATASQLEQEHDRLKEMVDRKSQVQRETEEERRSAEIRMRDLAAQAEDLRDLLTRLEQERERRIAEAAAKAAAEKAAREAELAAQKAAHEAEIAAQKAAREAELAARKAEQQAAAEAKEREKAQARAARDAEIAAQAEAREKQLAAQKATVEAEQASREAAASRLTRTGKPFSQMQGHLPFPARGRVVETFGQINDVGHQTKGISIQTRKGAQVIAPHDGQVVFAGPFRGYGLLLILEHSEGYHTLLAGMARVDATVGQRLTAGEPVGVMGQDDAKPALYLELRHHGQPVNPLPWLMARNNKASG